MSILITVWPVGSNEAWAWDQAYAHDRCRMLSLLFSFPLHNRAVWRLGFWTKIWSSGAEWPHVEGWCGKGLRTRVQWCFTAGMRLNTLRACTLPFLSSKEFCDVNGIIPFLQMRELNFWELRNLAPVTQKRNILKIRWNNV